VIVRDATPDDFAAVLALNEESVAVLSPLDLALLRRLHGWAAYHRVVTDADGAESGRVAAFLLALREGLAYESQNYIWFTQAHDRFLYIDRVVVARRLQGRGIGSLLYADLLDFAGRSGAGVVTCEFDLRPPNDASRRFHETHGFREVGRQRVAGGSKLVSLRELAVAQPVAADGSRPA
jgi:uncharacterized protein